MSKYLDIERFGEYLKRHSGSAAEREKRTVGAEREHESWYFDIVRFLGPGAVDPATVRIKYDTTHSRPVDDLITRFNAKVAAALRAEGKLYDGPPVTQIMSVDWSPTAGAISIRALDFADVVAGLAMDWPDELFQPWGGTLREYLQVRYMSGILANSPLISGVGVCGMLMVREGGQASLLKVRRSAKLASLGNSVGPSVAGSVEFAGDFTNLVELIQRSMNREVQEELGLKQHEFTVRPLAYAREMVRGDRPQLFTIVETTLTCQQIANRMEAIPLELREFSEYEFVTLSKGRLAETDIAALNFEAKMNYFLLEEWLAG